MAVHEHAWVPNARGSRDCLCGAWSPAPLPVPAEVAATVDGDVVPLRPPRRRKPTGATTTARRKRTGGAA